MNAVDQRRGELLIIHQRNETTVDEALELKAILQNDLKRLVSNSVATFLISVMLISLDVFIVQKSMAKS